MGDRLGDPAFVLRRDGEIDTGVGLAAKQRPVARLSLEPRFDLRQAIPGGLRHRGPIAQPIQHIRFHRQVIDARVAPLTRTLGQFAPKIGEANLRLFDQLTGLVRFARPRLEGSKPQTGIDKVSINSWPVQCG